MLIKCVSHVNQIKCAGHVDQVGLCYRMSWSVLLTAVVVLTVFW